MTTDPSALAALEQAATPAPWEADEIDDLWYQEADGQPVLVAGRVEPADSALIAALRNSAPAMLEELAQLRHWKAEALPVMAGLQDLGRALGVGLGQSITARASVDLALDLRIERDAAREQIDLVRRLVRLPEADQYRDEACRHVAEQPYADNRYVRLLDEVRALTTGGDRG